ncbi:hypothetical protein SEMRO_576_G169590.1 [Seminavis robusta]|uniref:Uncharacterized protein n=1 Tax=Seminavis robusta TaxID=568900 RepID=A0A9N8HFK5_9STRA|nr:hypothetical protein SEMRO_576_G169590.1 [Seminavis robusta]|eukprot:Sro576_g169590.1 n/a (95) ;mRNA; r:58043-58327
MSGVQHAAMVSKFLELAETRRNLHGLWVPAVYWAYLVARELKLPQLNDPSELKSALNKTTWMDEPITEALRGFIPDKITKVTSTYTQQSPGECH